LEPAVTDRIVDAWEEEADEAEEAAPGSNWLARIVIVAMLVGTGSGSALLWRAAGGGSLLPQSMTSSAPSAAVAAKAATPGDLDTIRQQITSLNQSNQQLLAAQQAEIKRLTDQVATLSGKLELLQRPVTSAQAAIPLAKPVAPPAAAKKKQDTAKPVAAVKPEPKPGVDPKPTGAISTGGAPLQLTR